ncbi:MAG: tetratricopeptide repeat protein [Brachymonas sp.]|nr:tetratricopeptide repeat protein [Brachymonas sp.]
MPSSSAQQHVKRVIKQFNPGADFKARLDEVERCGSMANKMALADECINTSQFDEAIRLYRSVMTGSYENDLQATYSLGTAYFYKRDAAQAIHALSEVVSREPMFDGGDAKLMLAQAYEGAGQDAQCRDCYESLIQHYAGEEARAQYIAFLARHKNRSRAEAVLNDVDKRFRLGSTTYRRSNKTWRDSAHQAFDQAFASKSA